MTAIQHVSPIVASRPALVLLVLLWSTSNWATADQQAAAAVGSTSSEAAARGYRYLTTKPYQPVDFTAAEFDALWKVWPPELKAAAEKSTPAERRRMAISRYGFVPNPDSPDGAPLGVVDTPAGWAMNCLSCHGGKVAGRVIPGLGNSHYAFQTLIQDVANAELASGQSLSPGQANTALIPLGRSNGTTNAQTASVLLSAMRDRELNLLEAPRKVPVRELRPRCPAVLEHQEEVASVYRRLRAKDGAGHHAVCTRAGQLGRDDQKLGVRFSGRARLDRSGRGAKVSLCHRSRIVRARPADFQSGVR